MNTVSIIDLEGGIGGSMAQKWAITIFFRHNSVRFGFSTINYVGINPVCAVLGGEGWSTLDYPNFGPLLLAGRRKHMKRVIAQNVRKNVKITIRVIIRWERYVKTIEKRQKLVFGAVLLIFLETVFT